MANLINKKAPENVYNLPIYGAGASVAQGAFLKKATVPGTSNGSLNAVAGSNTANSLVIGRLNSKLTFATDGETLLNGTAFVTKGVQIAQQFRIHRLQYSLASADLITCTTTVTTTTQTITSMEDDIDAAFFYVAAGTGIGQTNYATAAAAGASTLKAAYGTSLDTTSKIVKILPRFHSFFSFSTDGTQISSQVAVGASLCTVIDTYIEINGDLKQLNPVKHAALTGLNSMRSLRFWADITLRDTAPYSLA